MRRAVPFVLVLVAPWMMGLSCWSPAIWLGSVASDPATMTCATTYVDDRATSGGVSELECVSGMGAERRVELLLQTRESGAYILALQGNALTYLLSRPRDESLVTSVSLHVATRTAAGWSDRCVHSEADALERQYIPIRDVAGGTIVGLLVLVRDTFSGELTWRPEQRLDLGTSESTQIEAQDVPGIRVAPDTAWQQADGTLEFPSVRTSGELFVTQVDQAGSATVTHRSPPRTQDAGAWSLAAFQHQGGLAWIREGGTPVRLLYGRVVEGAIVESGLAALSGSLAELRVVQEGARHRVVAHVEGFKLFSAPLGEAGRVDAWTRAAPEVEPFRVFAFEAASGRDAFLSQELHNGYSLVRWSESGGGWSREALLERFEVRPREGTSLLTPADCPNAN